MKPMVCRAEGFYYMCKTVLRQEKFLRKGLGKVLWEFEILNHFSSNLSNDYSLIIPLTRHEAGIWRLIIMIIIIIIENECQSHQSMQSKCKCAAGSSNGKSMQNQINVGNENKSVNHWVIINFKREWEKCFKRHFKIVLTWI